MVATNDPFSAHHPSSAFSSHQYFSTQSPPPHLDQTVGRVREFVSVHARLGRRIVLITSGGTTVPLEHNVVRFLDNFSAGTRGSASAEYFLSSNRYAVIFLHRSHSLQPFLRHYPHSTHPFLDLVKVGSPSAGNDLLVTPRASAEPAADLPPLFEPLCSITGQQVHGACDAANAPTPNQSIQISPQDYNSLKAISEAYNLVKSKNLMLLVSFVTVNEYLFHLRSIAKVLGEPDLGLGRKALLYLAAAVSDFYIPQQKLFEHKIQSGKGSLVIEMDAVPKVLKDVTQEWSNQAFIVSFKHVDHCLLVGTLLRQLETDPKLLLPKSKAALKRYGHQLVIGNELHTRKYKCLLIDHEEHVETVELRPQQDQREEIEKELVDRLIRKHDQWISP